MGDEFRVLAVDRSMAETTIGPEQLGSKAKFWLRYPDRLGRKGIFKFSREHTGEHWAERIAAELAGALGLPHAQYDLAQCDGTWGVVSWTFLLSYKDEETLTHGNDILSGVVSNYPKSEEQGHYHRVQQHSVELVLQECERVAPPLRWLRPSGINNGADVMVGYLLLDAWIGNTDRHDENWGWVKAPQDPAQHLAPTYDHASSLGRIERDEVRTMRLTTRDPRATVDAYARRAKSALHAPGESKPLTTMEAFQRAAILRPDAARVWLDRLRSTSPEQWERVISQIPQATMSEPARQFAAVMLDCTRSALLAEHPS